MHVGACCRERAASGKLAARRGAAPRAQRAGEVRRARPSEVFNSCGGGGGGGGRPPRHRQNPPPWRGKDRVSMDIERLRAFAEVARQGSVTRAARRMRLQQ